MNFTEKGLCSAVLEVRVAGASSELGNYSHEAICDLEGTIVIMFNACTYRLCRFLFYFR